jgi:hypothetical protein
MENDLLALTKSICPGRPTGDTLAIVVRLVAVTLVLFCPLNSALSFDPPVTGPVNQLGRYFPVRDRVAMHEITGHMLNNTALPGGVLAEYSSWQLFLIRTPSNEKAAFLLFDYKKTLKNPKYLPHMGGFFGTDAGRQSYVFAKGPFLAGIVGLPEDKADVLAHEFAARIPFK